MSNYLNSVRESETIMKKHFFLPLLFVFSNYAIAGCPAKPSGVFVGTFSYWKYYNGNPSDHYIGDLVLTMDSRTNTYTATSREKQQSDSARRSSFSTMLLPTGSFTFDSKSCTGSLFNLFSFVVTNSGKTMSLTYYGNDNTYYDEVITLNKP